MQASTSLDRRSRASRRLFTFCTVVGVIAASTVFPDVARADFDRTLATRVAPAVLRFLRDSGFHAVGVLKFRVKRGNEPESFYVGPLNDNMATRLENALVYKSEDTDLLQLLQNPSVEAARQKQQLSYLTPAGREKLLDLEYSPAYGDATHRAKPDVLLTGIVEIRPLEHKAILTIEAFSKNTTDLVKVGSFEAPLDRAILVDAGMPFTIPKKLAPSDDSASDATADTNKPADDALLAVTILYDNKVQPITRKDGAGGELWAPEPKEKQELVLRLKNQSKERLGAVLLINGRSTYMKQRGLPVTAYKKWMFDPGDELEFTGFSLTGDQLERFVIRSDADSRRMMEQEELNTYNLGAFEIYVFRDSRGVTADNEEKPFSLGMRAKPTQRAKSLNEARSTIRSLMGTQSLGIVDSDSSNTTKERIEKVEGFKNPQLVTSMIIRYYHPKMKRIAD